MWAKQRDTTSFVLPVQTWPSVENALSLYEVDLCAAELVDPLIEVDFDHDVVSLAWDLSESCLVVGHSAPPDCMRSNSVLEEDCSR